MDNATLGKRIKNHRIRVGLTQEQLAERVGVSAQAVSKWENNLSCPDITILPELAEIFGISVDELLGRSAPKSTKVHDAVIVEDDENKHGQHFEISFGNAYRSGLWFAVYILCIGALTLIKDLLNLDVSFWSILWMTALFVGGVSGLLQKLSFFWLGITLTGIYFLLTEFSILKLDLGWGIVLPVCLLLWGFSLLIDALCRNRKGHRSIVDLHNKLHYEYSCEDGELDCELSFGEYRSAVTTPLLRGGSIESSFGEFTVDFSGCDAVAPNCHISVDHSFGSLTLLVPDKFIVHVNREDNTASTLNIQGQPCSNPQGTLIFDTDLNFGTLEICYA